MPLILFSLVILEVSSHSLTRLAWTEIFLVYASHLLPQSPTLHWDGVSRRFLFCLFIFCLGWPWTVMLLISTSKVAWNDWHVPLCSAIGWDGGLPNYLTGLASNSILPISASQVPKITGVSYQHPATLCLSCW
jgi:hypothetical protein